MKTYRDLDEARAALERDGGWLLDMGDDRYLVTDDEGLVRDLRQDMGEDYLDVLAAAGWDETKVCAADHAVPRDAR